MTWIQKHRRNWRIAVIALLMVAFMGPWVLERLYIPSEYECPIRLNGDFCGMPQSGISLFFWLSGGVIGGLVTGEFFNSERIHEFVLISLFLLLPLLPMLGTVLLIPDQDNLHKQVFTIIFWVLAIGFGIFIGEKQSRIVLDSMGNLVLHRAGSQRAAPGDCCYVFYS